MQEEIEKQKRKLRALKLLLAELEAERNRLQYDVHTLRSSLTPEIPTPEISKRPRQRITVTVVSLLAIAALLSIDVFHNAFSTVIKNNQSERTAINTSQTTQLIHGEHSTDSNNMHALQSGKKINRITKSKKASQRQWGPLLIMPEEGDNKRKYGFDPVVRKQQENLLTLGFDIGKADGFKGARTRQAIAEFRSLYLPDSAKHLKDAELAFIMENYANLARSDAARLGIDHGVVAAIRLSSVRTGVDFSYLMKLAATESNFKPKSKAATSSATGLYQFTHDTWLNTLKRHGTKYGRIADYAANIKYYQTRSGYQRPRVRDESIYQHLLALRKNPRISAMMAAETVRDNQQKLAKLFNRTPTDTDLYLTHFLGSDGAITFLRSLEQSPDTHAVELFPKAASSNRDIFHPRACEPRTVDEVYAHFGEKFNTRRYDDFVANSTLWLVSN